MKIILRIISVAFRYKRRLIASYVCMAGATAAYLIIPKSIGSAIDRTYEILKSGDISDNAILLIILSILGLYIVRGILSFAYTYLGESLSQYVAYSLRDNFYDHVQNLSFGFHDKHHTGNLMSRAISDIENVRMFINAGLIRGPYFLVLVLVVSVLLLRLDLTLGIVSIGFMPLVMFQSSIIRLKMGRIFLTIQEKMAELSTVLQENLTGIRVVKAFAAESYEEEKFDAKNVEVASHMIQAERLAAYNNSFMLFTFTVSLALILWMGGQRVIAGSMSYGELTQFIIYMQILAMPVRMAGLLIRSYARAASAGQRVFEILDTKSPVQEPINPHEMPRAKGHIRFENVSFSYDRKRQILDDITLETNPGQSIALIGTPGSGKSTIVNLIPRFYDVESGRITIDGTDIRDVTLASLRRNIGIVQQDVFLFTDSILENIAYGRSDASTEEIIRAAKIAQLHDFIESLECGYETRIGERGNTLSGGQKQRLSIARALLLDPPILILDDSASSIDAKTENLIRKAMESVMRDRTTFIIAHRLSTVHKADLILVMDKGHIVEKGTHHELLALGGIYHEIYELQIRPQEEVMLDFESPIPIEGKA